MRKHSSDMDKDVETKGLCQPDDSSQKQSYFDVKLEQIDSYWTQSLKKSTETIHLQEIFDLENEDLPYDQIYLKIKSHFRPQLEQVRFLTYKLLKQNRDNVKLLKLSKPQWNSQNNGISRYDDKIHYIGQQTVHQYSAYLKIDRNIKRQETQDLNFKYNFSTEMREKFKLDILKIPKTIWRTQEGINEMIQLNSRWALNNLDVFQLCSLYYYVVGKTNIDQFTSQELSNFLEQQLIEKNINLTINMDSLVQIFQSLKVKKFGRMKSNIFQVGLSQLQQVSIQQIQDLSFKSFQNHQFINRKSAYICNSCSQFDVDCVCQFENRLASLRKFLDFCVAQRTNSSKQSLWNHQVIKEATKNICGDQCYKDPKNQIQATKKLQQFPIIEENQPIIFDRDPCLLAKIYNSDCLTIFIQARFKYKEIRLKYIEDLQTLQKQCDDKVFENHPYDNSSLYIPCNHKEDFNCENCPCSLFCSKYCDCPYNEYSKCLKKYRGCSCRDRCNSESRCQCRRDQMECDPLLCKCCSLDNHQICSNMQILINNLQPTLLGRSTVCPGLGIFAKRYIMKDELIVLYCGEILVDDEDEIRDHFDDTFSFYNYSFSDDKYSIEARFCGNESRFINHNNNNYINSKTRQIFSQGKFQLAIYAIKNIEPEEEIILNYNEGEKINKDVHFWIDLNQKYWNYKQSTIIGNN